MPRESEIISLVKRRARRRGDVRVGIGDDAAVMAGSAGKDLLACCDLLVEGVHFQRDWTPPRLLGRKALAVNLSDVAAMGGIPKFAMISLALPRECSDEFISELFEGVLEIADEHEVSLIGGDTSASRDSLFIDVSLIGECAAGRAVTRGGAKPGDAIYVSGSLGASAVGLRLLQEGLRLRDLSAGDIRLHALMKHLAPEPQSKLGRAVGEQGLATAMIDISDGLSTDLKHILDESACGAVIRSGDIPIDLSVQATGDSVRIALSSGEEYELLFTANPERSSDIEKLARHLGVAVTVVGEIAEGKEMLLERDGALEPIFPSGYEHLI